MSQPHLNILFVVADEPAYSGVVGAPTGQIQGLRNELGDTGWAKQNNRTT